MSCACGRFVYTENMENMIKFLTARIAVWAELIDDQSLSESNRIFAEGKVNAYIDVLSELTSANAAL